MGEPFVQKNECKTGKAILLRKDDGVRQGMDRMNDPTAVDGEPVRGPIR
jgi:hypothetical protein